MGQYISWGLGALGTLVGTLILILWKGVQAELVESKRRLSRLEIQAEDRQQNQRLAVLEEKIARCEQELSDKELRLRTLERCAIKSRKD